MIFRNKTYPVPQFGLVYLGKGWFIRLDFSNRWNWSRRLNSKILNWQKGGQRKLRRFFWFLFEDERCEFCRGPLRKHGDKLHGGFDIKDTIGGRTRTAYICNLCYSVIEKPVGLLTYEQARRIYKHD